MLTKLVWLMAGAFAIGTEGFVIAGILPAVSRDLHVTIAQAGHLVMAFAFTYAIAAPVTATLTASWPFGRQLRLAMGGFTLANVIAALAPGFTALLIARVLLALFAGLFMAAAGSYAAASSEPSRRGRELALLYMGMTAATVLGVPLGTWVGNSFGWRATFWMIGLLSLVSLLGLTRLRPLTVPWPVPSLRERLRIAARPDVLMTLGVTLVCFAGIFGVYTYLSPLLRLVAGLSDDGVALALLSFGICGAIGNLLGGHMADRFGALRVGGLALAALGLVQAGLAWVAHSAPPQVAVYLVFGLIMAWGVVGWSFPPVQQVTLVQQAPQAVSVVLSLNASAMYFGIALGAWIGSLVVAADKVRSLPWVGAAGVFAAAGLAAVVRGRLRRAARRAQAAPLPA